MMDAKEMIVLIVELGWLVAYIFQFFSPSIIPFEALVLGALLIIMLKIDIIGSKIVKNQR
jgi:hypothetical protein